MLFFILLLILFLFYILFMLDLHFFLVSIGLFLLQVIEYKRNVSGISRGKNFLKVCQKIYEGLIFTYKNSGET